MADYSDPSNASVKPAIKSLEGVMALVVTLVTAAGAIVPMLMDAFPDNPKLKAGVAILGGVLSVLTALGYVKKRSDLKETVASGAVAIALARAGVKTENPT